MYGKDVICRHVITKMQQMALQKMSKIASLKKDLIILEKNKFSALKAENEGEKNTQNLNGMSENCK